jgi:hypothetical protein
MAIYGEGSVKSPVQGMRNRSLLHIPVAVGVGRSAPSQPSPRKRSCAFCYTSLEPEAEGDLSPPCLVLRAGPAWREALNHLFGIAAKQASPFNAMRRTPPFNGTTVDDGIAVRPCFGVILESSRPPVQLDQTFHSFLSKEILLRYPDAGSVGYRLARQSITLAASQ